MTRQDTGSDGSSSAGMQTQLYTVHTLRTGINFQYPEKSEQTKPQPPPIEQSPRNAQLLQVLSSGTMTTCGDGAMSCHSAGSVALRSTSGVLLSVVESLLTSPRFMLPLAAAMYLLFQVPDV